MLLVEEILALVIGLVMVTQVIAPVIANKPVFWLFRRSSRTTAKLRRAKQDEDEAQKLLEAAEHEARAFQLKQRAEATELQALDKYLDDGSNLH
jgi:membrane-associated HD superfamily phosphohydrolase